MTTDETTSDVPEADRPSVAMIGLGRIGLPLARRLLAAGYPVHGYRRSPCPELVEAGGVMHGSARGAATAAEVVLQCLPGEAALREAGFGESGVLQGVQAGQRVVELGTYSAALKREYRDALAARGVPLVEVEISGTPDMMAAGRAALFVGAEPGDLEPVAALLRAISATVIPVGGFGAALSMKLVANLLVATHTHAAAEALALGEALGLDGARVVEVIGHSPAASEMFRIRAPRMVEQDYLPAPGPIGTLAPYLALIEEAGREHALSLPAFDAARASFEAAREAGLSEHDIAAVRERLRTTSRG